MIHLLSLLLDILYTIKFVAGKSYDNRTHLNGIQLILIFREYSSNTQFFTGPMSSIVLQVFHSRCGRPAQGDEDQENQQRMLHFAGISELE